MKIAELKNRLSHYLRLARIERVEEAAMPRNDAEWLDRLERRGVIRRGTGNLRRDWVRRRPPIHVDLVAALLQDRGEGP